MRERLARRLLGRINGLGRGNGGRGIRLAARNVQEIWSTLAPELRCMCRSATLMDRDIEGLQERAQHY